MSKQLLRITIALAIERADNEQVPEGYANEVDHDEISDWGLYLADAVLRAARDLRRIAETVSR